MIAMALLVHFSRDLDTEAVGGWALPGGFWDLLCERPFLMGISLMEDNTSLLPGTGLSTCFHARLLCLWSSLSLPLGLWTISQDSPHLRHSHSLPSLHTKLVCRHIAQSSVYWEFPPQCGPAGPPPCNALNSKGLFSFCPIGLNKSSTCQVLLIFFFFNHPVMLKTPQGYPT